MNAPRIGEVRQGKDISPGYAKHTVTWHACADCGATRWVPIIGGMPGSERCRPCGQRRSHPLKERVSYSGAHARLRRLRGQAKNHVCHCGTPAEEWAYTHDDPCSNELTDDRGCRYSGDVNRYVPLCKHCHQIYDKSYITHCPANHEYTLENTILDAGKRKCKKCVYARNRTRKPTPEQQKRRIEQQRVRRAAQRAARLNVPGGGTMTKEKAS